MSCASIETDAQRVCDLLNETKDMFPKMMEFGMQSAFGDKEAESELSELEIRSARIMEDIENISSNYDEQEFQDYLLNNCPVAQDLKEFGEAVEALEGVIDDFDLE